jgi:hypothetical protein
MLFAGLLPHEAVYGRRPDRVHVAQFGLAQQRILFDQHLVAVLFQQRSDRLQVLLHIHFEHQLANLGPISGADSLQDVPFALFHVDLEQVNAFQAFLCDHAGKRSQLRGFGLGAKPVLQHFSDFGG